MGFQNFRIEYTNPSDSQITQLQGNALYTGGNVKVTVQTQGQSVQLSAFNPTTVNGTLYFDPPQIPATETNFGDALTLCSEALGLTPTGWQPIP